MISILALRHDHSWQALVDTIRLINKIHKKNVLKITKDKLLSFILEQNSIKSHIYCDNCKKYLGEKNCLQSRHNSQNPLICIECKTKVENISKAPYFVTLDVKSQLKKLLEQPSIQPHLQYAKNRVKKNIDAIEDILDGEIHKKLSEPGNFLSNSLNFSYTF